MEKKAQFAEANRIRTKLFALRVIKLFQALPRTDEARIIGKQLLRSATSVGANYRAVCRARSKAEFIAKLSITLEEADECQFWMELLIDSGIIPQAKLEPLINECSELVAILSSARRSVTNS